MTTHHYDDGTRRFDYTLILKPRMRHRYIRIRDGRVIVTAPRRTSRRTIEAFVEAKADWIARHLDAARENTPTDLTSPDAHLYWRGERYPVQIEHGETARLTIGNGAARFTLPHPPDPATLLTLFQAHCKQHAPHTLLPRIEHWAAIMDLRPTRIGFRRARTRWGSCSSRDSLSFNTWMMILPDALIDYIIVHELAHIRHKNHSRDFWELVARYIPDWHQKRKALRRYEPFLR
jgi:predicted metal-dependent hydrolase